MEHLQILSLLVTEYDMIMFCDDDDTYGRERVKKFVEGFDYIKGQCDGMYSRLGGIREVKNANVDDGPAEYWSYGIPPSLLTKFFNRCNSYEDLLRHKFADMYLRNYLEKMGLEEIAFRDFPLDISGVSSYNYTIDNPNSICMKPRLEKQTKENSMDGWCNAITLYLITDRIDLLREKMEESYIIRGEVPNTEEIRRHTELSKLRTYVRDADRIIELTKILYK
jgi:hypothetical protein